MRFLLNTIVLLLFLGQAGCVTVVRPACSAADEVSAPAFAASSPWLRTELYFGLGADGAREGISEEQWREFLDGEVTTRFPDGFTVLDAYGQWRDREDAPVERLRSKVIVLLHPPGSGPEQRIKEIRRAFTTRFRQVSVLRATHFARVGF